MPENPCWGRASCRFPWVGVKVSRMLIAYSPAGMMEQYFRDAQKDKASAGNPAFLHHYGMELLDSSPFWQS